MLFLTLLWVIVGGEASSSGRPVSPTEVGRTLFGPYLLAVEIASMLLLAGLVGAYHLGRRYLRDRRDTGEEGL